MKKIEITYETLAVELAAAREVYGNGSDGFKAVKFTIQSLLQGDFKGFLEVYKMSKEIKFKED